MDPRAATTSAEPHVSWVPWQHDVGEEVSLGRPFLIISGGVEAARVSPPPCTLPLVWRAGGYSCFELPLPVGRDEDATLQPVELYLVDLDGREFHKHFLLGGGIPRPERVSLGTDDLADDFEPSPTQLAGFDAEAFIAEHIESINEITFPGREARRRPERAEALSISSWEEFDGLFWTHDEDETPLRLIVRVAEDCTPVLEAICARPRRVLRRERRLERLDRVQQLDDACLQWFVRQPGRTILEKAGPRQRVLSVVRTETADTHENRVVRDFLERSLLAAELYLRENRRLPKSYRTVLVRRFRNRLHYWLKYTQFADVPRPTGVPSANYVLQFDDRYRRVWYWYERLRRQQAYQDEVWRWQHRTWAEHATLALMHALSELQGESSGFRGTAFIRTDPRCGEFVEERSAIGTWIVGDDEPLVLETIVGSHLQRAASRREELKDLVTLGPDVVVLTRRGFGNGAAVRILAVWASLRLPGADWHAAFEAWVRGLLRSAGPSFPKDTITPALFVPSPGTENGEAEPERISKWERGLYAVGFLVPVPVNRHLRWLTSQIRDWAIEGVL